MHRHPLVSYYLLAYLLTWGIEVPMALSARGFIDVHLPLALEALAAFGPFIAALTVLALNTGRVSVATFCKSLFVWRVPGGWLIFTLLSPFAVLFVALTISGETEKLLSGELISEIVSAGRLLELVLLGGIIRGLGEEPGWRGFALPALRQQWGPLGASLALFPVWWLWHLPSLLARPEFQFFQFFMFGLGILAATVWCTLLFDATRSVLMLALWHALINITRGIALSASTAAFMAFAQVVLGVAIVIAGYWLWRRPGRYAAKPSG